MGSLNISQNDLPHMTNYMTLQINIFDLKKIKKHFEINTRRIKSIGRILFHSVKIPLVACHSKMHRFCHEGQSVILIQTKGDGNCQALKDIGAYKKIVGFVSMYRCCSTQCSIKFEAGLVFIFLKVSVTIKQF